MDCVCQVKSDNTIKILIIIGIILTILIFVFLYFFFEKIKSLFGFEEDEIPNRAMKDTESKISSDEAIQCEDEDPDEELSCLEEDTLINGSEFQLKLANSRTILKITNWDNIEEKIITFPIIENLESCINVSYDFIIDENPEVITFVVPEINRNKVKISGKYYIAEECRFEEFDNASKISFIYEKESKNKTISTHLVSCQDKYGFIFDLWLKKGDIISVE